MPEDSFDKLKADMLANPEGQAALQRVLDDEAEEFLRVAVDCAKRIQLMDDVWQARRIMADATLWLIEIRKRMDKEITIARKPSSTAKAFNR